MKDEKIEMPQIDVDCDISDLKIMEEEFKDSLNPNRRYAKTIAYVGIVVSSMIMGFVLLSVFFPILYTFTTDSLPNGFPHGADEKLEVSPKSTINDMISWAFLGVGFGIALQVQFLMSCHLLLSTKTDIDPNIGQSRIQLWIRMNTFLMLLDIGLFYIRLYWLIFGTSIIMVRIIMYLHVKAYWNGLETKKLIFCASKISVLETEPQEK